MQLKGILKEKTPTEGHQGGLVLGRQCPGSPGTCNPEETGLPGLSMSYHPPYSPDLAPSDYHLFPELKKQLQGLFMCRFASIYLLQRLKGNMSGDARDFNNIGTRAVIKVFSPARQGAEGNSRHSDRNVKETCTIVCHRQKLGGPV